MLNHVLHYTLKNATCKFYLDENKNTYRMEKIKNIHAFQSILLVISYIEITSDIFFEVKTTSCVFQRIPLCILVELNKSYQNLFDSSNNVNNSNIYIPLKWFLNEVYLYNTDDNVTIEIGTIQNGRIKDMIVSCEAVIMGNIFSYVYINKNMRIDYPIQQTSWIYNISMSLECKVYLEFERSCKGYFLFCDDVYSLERVCISILTEKIIDYDSNIIPRMCVYITNHLLYIPIYSKNYFYDNSPNTYKYVVEHDKHKCVVMSLCFSKSVGTVLIGGVSQNHVFIYNKIPILQTRLREFIKFKPNITESGIFGGHQIVCFEKNICMITHERISYTDVYTVCSTCKHPAINYVLRMYFEKRGQKVCPMCRAEWYHDIFYINSFDSSI